MTLAQTANDLQALLEGPVHPRPRQPDQAPHREAVLDAVVAPGGPHARVHLGHARHLGLVERRHQARLPRRLLHAHAHDAVLRPGPQPVRRAQGLPRRRRRADDRGGRRGVRRLHLPRLHHRALPPRGHPPGARAGPSQGRQDARRTSRSPARASWSPAPTRRRWRRRPTGTRQQIAFYGSTPAYRGVLELHGWGDLQDELNALSKQGEWEEMGDAHRRRDPRHLRRGRRARGRRPRAAEALRRLHRPHQLLRPLQDRPRALGRGHEALQAG